MIRFFILLGVIAVLNFFVLLSIYTWGRKGGRSK